MMRTCSGVLAADDQQRGVVLMHMRGNRAR